MSLAPLFMAPFGPSREGPYGFSGISGLWNTENHGTDGPVTCEICGTTHPENRSESYLTFRFFGRQGVEQCCGALLDEAYRQFGDRITEAYLNNYAEDPCSDEFGSFRHILRNALERAEYQANMVAGEIKSMVSLAPK